MDGAGSVGCRLAFFQILDNFRRRRGVKPLCFPDQLIGTALVALIQRFKRLFCEVQRLLVLVLG